MNEQASLASVKPEYQYSGFLPEYQYSGFLPEYRYSGFCLNIVIRAKPELY